MENPNQRRIVRITRELIERFYEKKDNVCGGVLHIVTDDYNIRDSDIEFCIGLAQEAKDGDALRIANNMMLMTFKERQECLGITTPGVKVSVFDESHWAFKVMESGDPETS